MLYTVLLLFISTVTAFSKGRHPDRPPLWVGGYYQDEGYSPERPRCWSWSKQLLYFTLKISWRAPLNSVGQRRNAMSTTAKSCFGMGLRTVSWPHPSVYPVYTFWVCVDTSISLVGAAAGWWMPLVCTLLILTFTVKVNNEGQVVWTFYTLVNVIKKS